MAKRKCFVTYNSTTVEVFPQGLDKMKYLWEREGDQIFKRKKLSSKLVFINDASRNISDFTYFSNIELGGNACAEIKLEIKVLCSGQYANEWDGYFSTGAGRHDFDNCRFEVKPEPDDKYRCIFDKWETKKNIFDYGTEQIISKGNLSAVYETLVGAIMTGIQCGKCLRLIEANNPSFQAYHSDYSSAQDMINNGWCVKNKVIARCEVFTRLKIECAPGFCPTVPIFTVGQTVTFLAPTCPGTSATICRVQGSTAAEPLGQGQLYIWIKDIVNCTSTCCFNSNNVNDLIMVGVAANEQARIKESVQEQFYQVITTWHAETLISPCVSGNCPTLIGGWILIASDCAGTGNCTFRRCPGSSNSTSTIFRGVSYEQIIDDLVSGCDIDFVTSIFLDHNPDINDPHYVVDINYVTGAFNAVQNLMVAQASDVINPQASNPATIGMVTLKMLLDWARVVLNVYWDIHTDANENVVLRMEHYDFFEQQLSRDLRVAQYKQFVNNNNSYEHTKEKIPQYEEFKWSQAGGNDFIGRDIIYALPCATPEQRVSNAPEKLTTDVPYLFNNANAGDGAEEFVLIACNLIASDLVMNVDIGLLSGVPQDNGHLSWANLHFNYHRYNRHLSSGIMNDAQTTFFSWRPNIKQVALTIPGCCDIPDPEGYMLTELGEEILDHYRANVERMELDFKTDMLTITLSYST